MNMRSLKKKHPSYKDIFGLIEIEEEEQIFARLKRVSDKKRFSIELDWLKAVDEDSNNYQLLDDYAVWFDNY